MSHIIILILSASVLTYFVIRETRKDFLSQNDFLVIVGGIFSGVLFVMLLTSLTAISLREFQYNRFVTKRCAFVTTLKDTRLRNDCEAASISRRISKWNEELADKKVKNQYWLCDPYIDDRIDDLEFIK